MVRLFAPKLARQFLFFHSLPADMQRQWLEKSRTLKSARIIWRSSNFKEDSFVTSQAGLYISELTDMTYALNALCSVFGTHKDEISADYEKVDINAFLQEYISGDTSGIAFSNLGGNTTIESVIGEGEAAVKGRNEYPSWIWTVMTDRIVALNYDVS